MTTPGNRSAGERETDMLATALFAKRADARIESLSATEAAQLLGNIASCDMGQGAFNVVIPCSKVRDLCLDQALWEGAARRTTRDNQEVYELDYMLGVNLIGRLEVISGKDWNEMQKVKQDIAAARDERKIG